MSRRLKNSKLSAIPSFGVEEEFERKKRDIEFGKKARGGQYFKRFPASELIRPENKEHRKVLRREEELFGITTLAKKSLNKGTKARLNTAAGKMFFGSRYS